MLLFLRYAALRLMDCYRQKYPGSYIYPATQVSLLYCNVVQYSTVQYSNPPSGSEREVGSVLHSPGGAQLSAGPPDQGLDLIN